MGIGSGYSIFEYRYRILSSNLIRILNTENESDAELEYSASGYSNPIPKPIPSARIPFRYSVFSIRYSVFHCESLRFRSGDRFWSRIQLEYRIQIRFEYWIPKPNQCQNRISCVGVFELHSADDSNAKYSDSVLVFRIQIRYRNLLNALRRLRSRRVWCLW